MIYKKSTDSSSSKASPHSENNTLSGDASTVMEAESIMVPLTLDSENPLTCCNVKLFKAVQFFAIIFTGIRAAIFAVYLYVSLNTDCFLMVYVKHGGSSSIRQYAHGIRIASALLCMKETIFIISNVFLFVGAVYRKYEFLKCWLIFTSLHETLGLLAHIAMGLSLSTPILAFHFPLSLPFLALIVWLTLKLMHEIKIKKIQTREYGPQLCIGKNGAKAKDLYNKNAMFSPKSVNRTVFVESSDPYL